MFLLMLCLCLAARGRCVENCTKVFSVSFPVLTERGAFFSSCRQRTTTCPDKMALYNFKKIMVVPTAKVSFIPLLKRFKQLLFSLVGFSAQSDVRKELKTWWERKTRAELQQVSIQIYVIIDLL